MSDETKKSWFEQWDIKTVLLAATIASGAVANWFTMQGRIDDQSRRISVLESQLIPRSEQNVQNQAITARLQSIESVVYDIQKRLYRVER